MKFKFLILSILIATNSIAQNFSGEIEYEIKIIPKNKNFNLDSLMNIKKGSIAKYVITNNKYKSTYYKDNLETYSYTYDDVSKRMYDNYVENPYITYRDSRRANFNYKGSKIHLDSTLIILDKSCFMVEYDSDYGKSKVYYSNEIKVAYDSFKGHKVGNWYEKLKEVDGCLSIKTITEFDEYYEIQEAVKITPRTLDNEEFSLPENKKVVASYTALDKRVELEQPNQNVINCYLSKIQDAIEKKGIKDSKTSYLSFVVTDTGDIKYVDALEDDSLGLFKVAIDILDNCDLKFIAGEIDGKPVSSLTYFPIEFNPKK
ncbi:hypothetical protein [Winogradskyella flava]|uniref:TonB protein C-terminal n=1 Tax=Winogradskyella flava TaxID=1884876 RepID=A0A842IN13_9FLAO|nr:hypothetical protein [Winogradskyella flava]MBC2844632.1 hypothetical protein [Winogradskyella flava]